jgi:hypothetical protein
MRLFTHGAVTRRALATLALLPLITFANACSDSSSITGPQEPPTPEPTTTDGGSGWKIDMSRQPSGMSLITDRSFSSRATGPNDKSGASGWSPDPEYRSPFVRVVNDHTAPRGSDVWELSYPAGKPGNPSDSFSPVHAWLPISGRPRAVYTSVWLKVSDNWQGHGGAETKLVELIIANQSRVVISLIGKGSNPLAPMIRVNGGPDSRAGGYLPQNVKQGHFSRGEWHRLEAVLTSNTPGVADGGARWWLNGVELGNHTNVMWVGASEFPGWTQVDLNPIWGGRHDQLKSTQHIWVDHLYASVKQ